MDILGFFRRLFGGGNTPRPPAQRRSGARLNARGGMRVLVVDDSTTVVSLLGRMARAEGDAQRFNLIESQYRAAPDVTRKRLYLETMEQVVANTPKVIDLSSGKNILSLPGATDARVPAATVITPDSGKGGR